ncbi:MAG: C25 family cysteine peptidase [Planctomycetota bacterium]
MTVTVSAFDMLTFHNDTLRTGANTNETILTQSNVTPALFGKLYTRTVDGVMYAQPLYASAISIGGGTHNVIFVATMHNTIYAFDADNKNQAAYWQKSMGLAVPYGDVYTNGDPNMYPEIGVCSTPVIDKSTNTMYVVAMTKEGANSYAHRLHALDIGTGNEKFGGPVLITTAPINGSSAFFSSYRQGQRPALLLANGSVYFSFASFGDLSPYWGWIMRYNAATLAQQNVLNVNPANANGLGSGIWQSGCGAAADASGNIYLITGNSNQGGGHTGVLTGNYSETALKLGPTGLAVTDYFTPSDVDNIDGADADFGGGGHVLLPDQAGTKPHVMVCAGKNGQLYVIDRDNMTHYLADNDARIMQKIGIGSNKGAPVYWQSPTGPHVFAQNEDGGSLLSFAIGVNAGLGYIQLTQDSQSSFGFQSHQMALSSKGSTSSTGIIWTWSGTGGDLIHQTTPYPATLRAFNAETLVEIYNSGQAANGRDTLGGFAKYNTATVANGRVYVPTSGNGASDSISQLQVYGLFVDTTPPTITSVNSVNTNTKVVVVFSEFVNAATATNIANYAIDHSVTISNVTLAADQMTVTLTTSPLSTNVTYTLTVNNVKDQATTPNTILSNTQAQFTYQVIPPTVSITSPTVGTTFTAPAVFSISASASAGTAATLSKVEFFINGAATGTVLTAPYMVTLTNIAAGTYSLTAKATDNNNFSTTSAPVSITVGAGNGTYGLTTRPAIGPYLNNLLPTLVSGTLPATLSATGAFSAVTTLTPSSGVIPYTVNSPLWSDNALKQRWLAVPNNGSPYTPDQQIGFAPTGEWTFPNGSVFIKHFDLPVDDTNPSVTKRLETRILVRSSDGNVYGVTYKWRADNSDADLLTANGLDEAQTITTATGTRSVTWRYPSRIECLTCHTVNSGGVLGLKTRQQNCNLTYPTTGITDNQLRTFNHVGLLNPVIQESAIATYTKLVNVNDTTATLDARARSYIDANCALCHRPGGTNAAFDARYDTPLSSQKIVYGAVLNNLGITGAKVVVPQNVALSLLYQRPNTLSANKMPPLAHNVIDTSSQSAIASWIGTLPVGVNITPNQGVTTGGNTVTITGTGFVGTTTVTFGGVSATNVVVSNATTLTCVVPASVNAAIGAVDVIVSDGLAVPSTVLTPGGYTYSARAPEFADATGKSPGVCATFFTNGDSTINSTGPGTFDSLLPYQGKVVKTNAMAGPNSSAFPGTILNLIPANATNFYTKIFGYLKITTPGVYTLYTASDDGTLMYLGNTSTTTSQIVNNNFAQGVTEVGGQMYLATGLHQFTILYGQGGGEYGFSASMSGPDSGNAKVIIPDSVVFVDSPPAISSATPTTGGVGGNTLVTLTGTGFAAGATVTMNGIAASSVTVASATSMSFRTPGGPAGSVNSVVSNPNGVADSTPFTYDSSIARPADNPANAVQGTFFRFYSSGNSGTEPGGPTLPNFAAFMPYRAGTLATAAYLPENTVTYPAFGTDGFSLQYTGYLQIPSDGTYNFYTASDDGSRMYIGGAMVVDNNFAQGITARTGISIKLKAGLHKYTVQFAEGDGGYGNYIGWGSADAVPTIPMDNGTPHGGAPTTQIPTSAYYYVPPTWIGTGTSNWSTVANWNTDTGLGAFSPNSTDTSAEAHSSMVLRFPASGAASYFANNDSPNATSLNVLELSSAISGNVISGAQLQFVGTVGFPYNGSTQASILQLGSGAVTVSAPVYVRETTVLGGNGSGVVTLSGTLTNYTGGGSDIKNLIKNGSSTYVLAGDGSGFTLGSIALNAGTLGVNSPVNAATAVVASGTTLRGTGAIRGAVTVKGVVFPGDVSSTLTNAPKGTLTVNSADFSVNAGTLRSRVWLTDSTHVEADNLTLATTASTALKLDGTSTLDLRIQVPAGATVANNLDVEIVHGGDINNNLYSAGFGNLTVSYGGSVTNMRVLYVNKNFTPNAGDTVNIVSTQLPGQAPAPAIGAASFNRIFVRFNNSVTLARIDSFVARAEGAGTLIEWAVASEYQNAGFTIWRRDAGGVSDVWTKINATLIPGRITHPDSKTYRLYDWSGGGPREYRLECVNIQGVGDYYSKLAAVSGYAAVDAPTPLDAPTPVGSDGLDAALASVQGEVSKRRGEQLRQRLAQKSETAGTLSARITRVDRNTDASILNALGFASVADRGAINDLPVPPEILPPTFGSRGLPFGKSSATGAKVVYKGSGVIKIPQSSMPLGLSVGALKIQREDRVLPALATTGDALILFGAGYTDEYTDKDAIFLARSGAKKPIPTPAPAQGLFDTSISVSTTVLDHAIFEYHDVYFDWDLRPYSYPPWFSRHYLTDNSTNSFVVRVPNATTSAAVLTVNVWSISSSYGTSPGHRLQAFVNGAPVGIAEWDGGGTAMALTFTIPAGTLLAGDNTIELDTPPIAGAPGQLSLLHSLSVTYTKALRSSGAVDIMHPVLTAQVYEVAGLPVSNLWVVDARTPNQEALVPYQTQVQNDGTYTARFTATAGRSGRFQIVPAGSEINPLSVTLRAVKPLAKTTKYLAVGPGQFASAIQPLIVAHTKEGLRSVFVDQESIFDYYGYGRYGPAAIQKAVRATRPKYVLLVGRTTFDYLNYSGGNVDPLCPSFLISTSFWSQTTSDARFGDLGKGYAEISVGRMPVYTPGDLTVAVNRTLNYNGVTHSGWRGHLVADANDPDAGDFSVLADDVAAANSQVTWSKNYFGVPIQHDQPAVSAALTAAANGGTDVIVYVGHGSALHLGNQLPYILDTDSVQQWTGNVVLLQGTCTANWIAKDVVDYQSIAIKALTQPQGGIALSIGNTTYCTATPAVDVLNNLLQNTSKQQRGKQTMRWGDVLLQALHYSYEQGRSAPVPNAQWFQDLAQTECLLGDPALPIYGKIGAKQTKSESSGKF